MATNIQINTGEDAATLYFQDGSSMSVPPNSNESIQLVDSGFCTISEAPPDVDEESGEHPPPGYVFGQMMVKFWQGFVRKITGDNPTATPMSAAAPEASAQRRNYKKKEGDDGYGDEPPQ